jgi:urease accessory protein
MVGEIVVFGRTARGEAFTQGLLHDRWSMRVDNRLVWADALRLDGDIAALLRQPAGFNGALAQATLIYVGADAAERLDQCRQLANDAANVTAGASRIGPVIVARLLADDAQALRRAVGCYWAALRHAAAGLPAVLPRLWHC